MRSGETLLVQGAAGGVGLAAVDIGRFIGAKVIAVASTQEKRDFLLSYGANFAISPENLIPPSAITGVFLLPMAFTTFAIAEI